MPLYRGSRRLIVQRKAAGLDAATTAWIAAVVGAGGAVSATQQGRVDTLIKAMKAGVNANYFTLMDRLYLFAGESDAKQATISIVNPAATAAVVNGTITLSAGGYTSDGTTGYLDTGYIPSSGGGNYVQNSANLFVYVHTALSTNHNFIGAVDTGGSSYSVIGVSSFGVEVNDGNFPATLVNTNGLWLGRRTSSSGFQVDRNGSQIYNATAATSSVVPNNKMFIAASASNTGTAGTPSTDLIKTAGFGGGMTSAQGTEFAAILNAYMTAWGVNTF